MSKPTAVLISDIHFTPNTLELASAALRGARDKATALKIPLVLTGDTLDTKSLLRAECVNRLIEIFTEVPQPETYVLVGNHDLQNEKGNAHSLEFLRPYVTVVDIMAKINGLYLLAYQTDPDFVLKVLDSIPKDSTLICHQGVQGAYLGHYAQDKTSLPPESFADFRVISGHYHRRQDIKTGSSRKGGIGLFSYIGTPYTQNFAEASDPEKGFQILHDDGSLQFVSTNLRKHVVVDIIVDHAGYGVPPDTNINSGDLIWAKVSGNKSDLDLVNKQELGAWLCNHSNYKLDLIPTDGVPMHQEIDKNLSNFEKFDNIIDRVQESDDIKAYLKTLWRETLEST